MLHSESAKLAFAHYPKTAGHSLASWFRRSIPDALYIEPPKIHTISHFGVRESLEVLGLSSRSCGDLRIIGVIREPFEMLVSLYEYWRGYEFHEQPRQPLIQAARNRLFPEFLAMAVGDYRVRSYEDFFDVGGPAWPTTRLLDFHSLQPALAAVCNEFGIKAPETLERLNAAPQPVRDLSRYRDEAGSLIAAVHRHFAWYYDEGVRIMLRG